MPDTTLYIIQSRELRTVCTDPQRRCYDGAFASSEKRWEGWKDLHPVRGKEAAEEAVRSWTSYNENSGRTIEYRAVPEEV